MNSVKYEFSYTDEYMERWLGGEFVDNEETMFLDVANRIVIAARPHSGFLPFWYHGDRALGDTAGFACSWAEVNDDMYEQAIFEIFCEELFGEFPNDERVGVETFGGFGQVQHLIVDYLDESGALTDCGRRAIELRRSDPYQWDGVGDRVWELEYEEAERLVKEFVEYDWATETELRDALRQLGPFQMLGYELAFNDKDEMEAYVGLLQDAAQEWLDQEQCLQEWRA